MKRARAIVDLVCVGVFTLALVTLMLATAWWLYMQTQPAPMLRVYDDTLRRGVLCYHTHSDLICFDRQ